MKPLTKAQQRTLVRALRLEESEDACIFPNGSSQHQHFRRLQHLGALVCLGYGRDVDGDTEEDVLCYGLTPLGRLAAKQLAGVTVPARSAR